MAAYLDDRATKERSPVLCRFLRTISEICLNSFDETAGRIEYGREQAEAFLQDMYRDTKNRPRAANAFRRSRLAGGRKILSLLIELDPISGKASEEYPDSYPKEYRERVEKFSRNYIWRRITFTDMTALIARTGAESVDWVGTSMGGRIGMLLAAEANTPIRRLVINDAGPFVPRIGAHVGQSPVFDDLEGVEKYMREIYAPFGDLSDENWRHLARYGARAMPDNKLSLAWDPAIAQPFPAVNQDVDLWSAYDRIRCPVLLLHGLHSDVLPTPIAQEMTQRGPRAELVEFPKIGYAPALMDPTQIAIIAEFLRP